MFKSIGMIELRSIAKGIETADIMVKSASIDLLFSKTTCPGKFLVLICGDVGAVKEALAKGIENAENFIVDTFILPAIHEDIIEALTGKINKCNINSLGILETISVASGIVALDKALKYGEVSLYKLNIGIAIGGKCYFVLSGDLSSVEEALKEAEFAISSKKIIEKVIIPYPSQELLNRL